MIHQHQRITNQPTQQPRRLANRRPAKLEVPKASVLQRREMFAICCEEGIQRHGEDIYDG